VITSWLLVVLVIAISAAVLYGMAGMVFIAWHCGRETALRHRRWLKERVAKRICGAGFEHEKAGGK